MATPVYTTSYYQPSPVSSTNLGPLSTSISFPPNCLNNLYDLQTTGLGVTWSYETQGCALSTCCPSEVFYTKGWDWFSTYFSPAVCPSQYKSCAPWPDLWSSNGETVIFCCPSNYECPFSTNDGLYWACQSGLASNTPVTVLNGLYEQQVVTTREFSATPGWTSWQVAYPIQIRFQKSELSSENGETFVTAAVVASNSPNSAASSRHTSSSGSAATAASNPDAESSGTSGLSTGAKAGIGVGVALAVLIGLALGIWVIRRNRQRKQIQQPATSTSSYQNNALYSAHNGTHEEADVDYAYAAAANDTSGPHAQPQVGMNQRHELGSSLPTRHAAGMP